MSARYSSVVKRMLEQMREVENKEFGRPFEVRYIDGFDRTLKTFRTKALDAEGAINALRKARAEEDYSHRIEAVVPL